MAGLSTDLAQKKYVSMGPADFDSNLAAAHEFSVEHGTKLFVFAYGAEGEDGNSWCPDCVDAKPVIEGALSAVAHAVVYASCDRAEYKTGPAFSHRTHQSVMLQALPQLNVLDSNTMKPTRSVVENDCKDAAKIAKAT